MAQTGPLAPAGDPRRDRSGGVGTAVRPTSTDELQILRDEETPVSEPAAPPTPPSVDESSSPSAAATPAKSSKTPKSGATSSSPAKSSTTKSSTTKSSPAKSSPAKSSTAKSAASKSSAAKSPAGKSSAAGSSTKAAKPGASSPASEPESEPKAARRAPGPRPAPKNVAAKKRPRPVPAPDEVDPPEFEDALDAPAEPLRPVAARRPPAERQGPRPVTSSTHPPKRATGPRPVRRAAATPASAPAARRPAPVTSINAIRASEPAVDPEPDTVAAPGRYDAAAALAQQTGERLLELLSAGPRVADIETKLTGILEFARRRLTGEYEVDEFGFDAEFTETFLLSLLTPLYQHWFRVEVRGVENIPSEGGALVVANHSGTVAMDAVMTGVAIHKEHPQKRHLRMLGADLVFDVPVLSQVARRGGATLANNADAERLLSTGNVVGVWPEGFKGVGKPFSERYKLQRFGRGGFVTAALRTGMPIVPCSIVGAEEIYPMIGNLPSLARLFNLPYLPLTPTFPWLGPLGLIPLPSKWLIEFSPPVPTAEYESGAADDPMLVFDLTDQVRQTIQQTLYSLLVQRRSVFF